MAVPIVPIVMALAQFAPTLMKMFGVSEPTVGVANKVVSIAQTLTGTGSPEEALAAMQASTDKQIEFNLAVMAQDKDITLAFLADVQDARARDNTFRSAGIANTRGDILAYAAVAGFMIALGAVLFYTIPAGTNRDLLFTMFGALIGIVNGVYSFEFGTTRQSKDKDRTISDLATKPVKD